MSEDKYRMTPEQYAYYSEEAMKAKKKAYWTPERSLAHQDCDRYCHCGAERFFNEMEQLRETRRRILNKW